MRRSLIVAAIAALLLVGSLAPAGATPPADVNIVSDAFLSGTGEFTATGPAVDGGVVCDAGETLDILIKATGSGPWGFNIQVLKEFTCDDGSGTFLVKVQVRKLFEGPFATTFNWIIVSGTGNYEDLHGAGKGVGLDVCGPDCVLDVYEGGLHND